jgi:hypothetical protein
MVACKPMRKNMWAYQTVTNNPWPHINAELLLLSTQYSLSYNSQIKCFQLHVDMNFFLYVELEPRVYPHHRVI